MFWYELPHFDTIYLTFERMNARMRWLITLLIFSSLGLCWYFFVYSSIASYIASYQDSIEHILEQQKQLSSRRDLHQRLQQEMHNLNRKLQGVEVALAGHKQPCMWINRFVHDFELELIRCSCDPYAEKKSITCTLQGQLSQLKQFCNHVHGLHTGWIIDSLSLQPVYTEDQAFHDQMVTDDIYTIHVTLVQTISISDESQETA